MGVRLSKEPCSTYVLRSKFGNSPQWPHPKRLWRWPPGCDLYGVTGNFPRHWIWPSPLELVKCTDIAVTCERTPTGRRPVHLPPPPSTTTPAPTPPPNVNLRSSSRSSTGLRVRPQSFLAYSQPPSSSFGYSSPSSIPPPAHRIYAKGCFHPTR